ncbi:MAG: preprotein translocase subunit YajC [Bacteroidetes bacterium]|nr:MAG: preprotein translocase subunit YajC [Bacteroidota bacterium]
MEILLLQAAPEGGGMIQLIFFGAMLLIFWFFLIRPQAKRQREQVNFAKEIKKGDEVVTASGIIGKVNKIEGDIVTLEVGNKLFIPVVRSAISKEMTDAFFKSADKS